MCNNHGGIEQRQWQPCVLLTYSLPVKIMFKWVDETQVDRTCVSRE